MKPSNFIALAVVIVTSNYVIYSQTETEYVHENNTPNPTYKAGYSLIFSDDFDGTEIDEVAWNVSDYNNDGTVHCTDVKDYPFTKNPNNVTVSGGYCNIKITEDDYADCGVSCGEIKTLSNNPSDGFDAWLLDYGFYIEIRVKDLPIKSGLGSSGWLFAAGEPEYNEIDIWETDGINTNKFRDSYWWEEPSLPECADEIGKVDDHTDFKVKNLDDPTLFGFKNFNLSNKWLTFGLGWEPTKIEWFLNNTLIKSLDITATHDPSKNVI